MEINIKRIGYKIGTVGWLAAGLQSGAITITESTLKSNGNHGLWLKATIDGKPLSQYLAAYDRYGVGDELPGARTYETAAQCSGPDDREAIWTDAAWHTLMAIAGDWCEMCNAERDADTPIPLKVIRTA